jgi:MFS family permease
MMRQTIFITVLGHFGAAFAALCMPPFYAHILYQNFSNQALVMAGWYFTLPTLAAAIANPIWGKLADRIGYVLR